MKFYAVGFELVDGKFLFYGYTCKFFSERLQIDENFYDKLRGRFTLASNKNNYQSGMYFLSEI